MWKTRLRAVSLLLENLQGKKEGKTQNITSVMSVRAWYARSRAVSSAGVGRWAKIVVVRHSGDGVQCFVWLPHDWWHVSVIDIALMICNAHEIVVNWLRNATCMRGEIGGNGTKEFKDCSPWEEGCFRIFANWFWQKCHLPKLFFSKKWDRCCFACRDRYRPASRIFQ